MQHFCFSEFGMRNSCYTIGSLTHYSWPQIFIQNAGKECYKADNVICTMVWLYSLIKPVPRPAVDADVLHQAYAMCRLFYGVLVGRCRAAHAPIGCWGLTCKSNIA